MSILIDVQASYQFEIAATLHRFESARPANKEKERDSTKAIGKGGTSLTAFKSLFNGSQKG